MYDVHSLVDIGSLVFAVASTYLACRRTLIDRMAKTEADIAEIRGVLRGKNLWDGE